MPGEELGDALAASMKLRRRRSTIVTRLESITSLDEAEASFEHYLEALDRIHRSRSDVQISVKPTQLGLDQSAEECFAYVKRIVGRAAELGDLV